MKEIIKILVKIKKLYNRIELSLRVIFLKKGMKLYLWKFNKEKREIKMDKNGNERVCNNE